MHSGIAPVEGETFAVSCLFHCRWFARWFEGRQSWVSFDSIHAFAASTAPTAVVVRSSDYTHSHSNPCKPIAEDLLVLHQLAFDVDSLTAILDFCGPKETTMAHA